MLYKTGLLTMVLMMAITMMGCSEELREPDSAGEVASSEVSASDTSRYERGARLIGQVYGDPNAAENLEAALADIAPDMARFIIEFPYGDIYSRPGLDMQSREIATVAALTAMGNARPQLKTHIRASLNVGVSPEELVEIIIQMALYPGFPASLNALDVASEVFTEENVRFQPEMTQSEPNRFERGSELIGQVYGDPNAAENMMEGLGDIAPDMARFILEFPYGDIYSRPGVDMKKREIAVVAALTALGNARPQLKTHIRASLNVGVSEEEIIETIIQMALYAGFPASLNALDAAREVFQE
jgi:4-carboxymuconolactone decarboxylase